jgi:4-diphosphocytidyl-2-C-methyl-D-erythritol kinase
MNETSVVRAPAKLNLDLFITGRRDDGYHELDSLFCLIDLYDEIILRPTLTPDIVLTNPIPQVLPEDDLTVKAARLLQAYTGVSFGVSMTVKKQIPMGAGLGGGSSDAAAVLKALNQLWHCDLSEAVLSQLGAQLGADVPFFVGGQSARVRGIGERIDPIDLDVRYFVLLKPLIHMDTGFIFKAYATAKSSLKRSFDVDLEHPINRCHHNDLQSVVIDLYPEMADYLRLMQQAGGTDARLTGSGSTLFCSFKTDHEAADFENKLKKILANKLKDVVLYRPGLVKRFK